MNMGIPAEPMEQKLSHLAHLRRDIVAAETLRENARVLKLGVESLDLTLSGGLPCAALHEIGSVAPVHLGAAAGFTLALATRAQERGKETLWIITDCSLLQTGTLYGPGLHQFGLSVDRLLIARVARPVDALFAMEEALKCRALSTVVAEFAETQTSPQRSGSRLQPARAARSHFCCVTRPTRAPSVATTRWEVASAQSQPDEFGGLRSAGFALTLTRNRRGTCGAWTILFGTIMSRFTHRYLSMWLRRLPTDRIESRKSTPAEPLVIKAPVKGALRLSAVNDLAAARGLKAGMALADVRAMFPRLPSRMRTRKRIACCSWQSPTGATATRRWSGLIASDGLAARRDRLRSSVRR